MNTFVWTLIIVASVLAYLGIGALVAPSVWRWWSRSLPYDEPQRENDARLGFVALIWPLFIPVGLITLFVWAVMLLGRLSMRWDL